MKPIPEVDISQLHDKSLDRLVRIYYFMKDGKKFRDARILSRHDYADMQDLLEESFPGQFRKQDVTYYPEWKLSKTFNNVYDSYFEKYGFLLGKKN